MFVQYNKNSQKFPIKIWCENAESIDENCMEQAMHLANLPFIYKWVALMPDTHMGKGMPIGAVIACNDVVIPNAVGVDIGCGMGFIQTNIPVKLLKETVTRSGNLVKVIVGNIQRTIPLGVAHYKKPQESAVLSEAK